MTPEFESVIRRRLPVAILAVILIALAFLFWKIAYGGGVHIPPLVEDVVVVPVPPPIVVPPEPVDEWLYVNQNNVLLWPVVRGECRIKSALMQVHIGTKVLVVHRHGKWVEIEQDDQTALHTHGCIHETMLIRDDD